MAVTDGTLNPYDATGPFRLDISEQIDVVAPERQVPFLSVLGWGQSAETIASASMGSKSLRNPCISFEHQWQNDDLVPTDGATTAAHTAAGATITVGATQTPYFRVDDIVRVKSSSVAASVADIYYIVTTVGATTLSVTALNTDQDFASGDPWKHLGQAKKVGAAANTTGKFTDRVLTSNYTQIFSEDVRVTGTMLSTEEFGRTNQLDTETEKTFERLVVMFEHAVTFGLRSTAVPTDSTVASRMGGFYYYTKVAAGGLSLDLGGAPISEATLESSLDTIWRAGGYPDLIMMNSVGLRELKKAMEPFVQTSREERTFGLAMHRYESPQGLSLDIVLNRHLDDSDFIIMTKDMVGVGPLEGNGNSRAFASTEIPQNGGDYRARNIRGEYTMEVRNAPTHHMWVYGGNTSVSS